MHGRRERIRRALSVVVLGCAFMVLVATSQPQDDISSQRFEFDAAVLDGATEVLEGRIGPVGDVPTTWRRRAVTVDVTTQPASMVLIEILDHTGAVNSSSLHAGEYHEARGGTHCADASCRTPFVYRVQSLDGGQVEVEVRATLSFTAGDPEEHPDVPVEASPPKVAPRTGLARSTVLETVALRADRSDPVDAVWLSWETKRCDSAGAPRLALLRSASGGGYGAGRQLMTVGGVESDDEQQPSTAVTQVAGHCEQRETDVARHSTWVVLNTTDGTSIAADLAVVGTRRASGVRVDRAQTTSSRVQRLLGADYYMIDHEVPVPDIPTDPPPVYLLTLEVPLSAGVEANFQDYAPDLEPNSPLHLAVSIDAAELGPPPDAVEARVVVYEISVP